MIWLTWRQLRAWAFTAGAAPAALAVALAATGSQPTSFAWGSPGQRAKYRRIW